MHKQTTEWLKSRISLIALAAVMVPVSATTAQANTVWSYIEKSADDAEEKASGAVDTNDQVMELGYERGRQTIGLRYELNVSHGDKINSAKLVFQGAKSGSSSSSLVIKAQDTDNAPGFSGNARNISGRTKTSASVNWRPAAVKNDGNLTSPNIAKVVQEVIDRNGWNGGNGLVITLATTGGTGVRPVESFDGSGRAPILIVDYTPGKGKPSGGSAGGNNGGGNSGGGNNSGGNNGGSEEVPLPDTDLGPSGNNGGGVNTDRLNAIAKRYESASLATLQRDASRPVSDWSDPNNHFKSGSSYRIGRMGNMHVTGLLTAYYDTGNRAYLTEIGRLMNQAKRKLSVLGKEGKLGMVGKYDTVYRDNDRGNMDDLLGATTVAVSAYAMKLNGDTAGSKYWTNWLVTQYEPKWKIRNHKKDGALPYNEKHLFHPYIQNTRLHYYIYKLTGDKRYLNEVNRRVKVIENHFRSVSTKVGTAYIWGHDVRKSGGCAPIPYMSLTISGLTDLNRVGLIKDDTMRKVANNLSQKVIGKDYVIASNSCGERQTSGDYKVKPKGTPILTADESTPMGLIARFDSTGWIKSVMNKVDQQSYAGGKARTLVKTVLLHINK